MTESEDLGAALAEAEAAREYLEGALVEAKSMLINTVTGASKIDAIQTEASAKVEKARARCRQLRAALDDASLSEFITRSRKRLDILTKHSDDLSKREATASPPSIQPREHAVGGENKRSQDETRRRKLIYAFSNALATSPHVRETIGLLALVFAYLQYYYFDVQLQIMRLPSITVYLPQK